MKYTKPALTHDQQIELLKSRGLLIENPQDARYFLEEINYYRFSAYCLPFELKRHQFKENTTFNNIADLYKFDRRLRHLISEALEIIEIYLRAKITYILTLNHDIFIHEDSSHFRKKDKHQQWLSRVHEEIERSKETFAVHYKKKYDNFPKLPLWMAIELMSFGALSRLFNNLKLPFQIEIGRALGFQHSLLISWIHSFNFVRNVCAHHARIWNREMAVSIKRPKLNDWQNVSTNRIGSTLYALNTLLKTIPNATNFRKDWLHDIDNLILSSSQKDFTLRGMAFSIDHPLWTE